MAEYTPNSHKSKEDPEKRINKIVTEPVKVKKKNEIRKFADVFIPEDVTSVRSYILTGIIVPLIKNAISQTVDALLYPDGGGHSKKGVSGSKVSYQRYYERGDDRRRESNSSSPRRMNYDYNDIVIPNRGEAERVLRDMQALIREYDLVRVADYYEAVGITGEFTDNNFGWTNLDNARVISTRDGFMIKLPKAMPLD